MMIQLDSGRVFAECEACNSGFWTPAYDDSFSTADLYWERRGARLDEARDAGWTGLQVQGELPRDDQPTPEDVAAFLALDRVPLERVPWWAATWLAQGFDGDNLRILAGEHGDDPYTIKDLLPQALEEMAVSVPSTPLAAVDRVFTYLARRCVDGSLTERALAAMVDHIVAAGGFDAELYDLPLGGLYGLDDEWDGRWGRTEELLRAEVRKACEAQLSAAGR